MVLLVMQVILVGTVNAGIVGKAESDSLGNVSRDSNTGSVGHACRLSIDW